jgi:hypothetical protein
MAKTYTIRSGDTLTKIAAREGFSSWREIYYDPDNAPFRRKRPNPDKIFPGDVVVLPDKRVAPTVAQTRSFRLHIISNFAMRHEPRLIIIPVNGSRVFELSMYRFHPKILADAVERKLGGHDGASPSVHTDFRTTSPAAANAFAGPASFMQIMFEPDPPMCQLFLRANTGNGLQEVVQTTFVAPRGTQSVMPAHGELLLLDDGITGAHDPRMSALRVMQEVVR